MNWSGAEVLHVSLATRLRVHSTESYSRLNKIYTPHKSINAFFTGDVIIGRREVLCQGMFHDTAAYIYDISSSLYVCIIQYQSYMRCCPFPITNPEKPGQQFGFV